MKTLISVRIFSGGQIAGIVCLSILLAALIGLCIFLGYLLHKRGARIMQTDTLQQQRNALMQKLAAMRQGNLPDDLPDTKVLLRAVDEESEDDGEESEDDESDVEAILFDDEESEPEVEINEAGNVVRYNRSFTARITQANNDLKARYSELKNYLLSYGVRSNISWRREVFRVGRRSAASFVVRGKTLCLCLAVDPALFADTKYKIDDVSGSKKKNPLPSMYRIKSDRSMRYAKELADIVLAGFRLTRNPRYEPSDYTLPYKSTEVLVKRRLIKVSGNVSDVAKEDALAAEKGISYNRSFTARIIQSDDALKARYSKLKNHLLAHKDIVCSEAWKHEAYKFGRENVATLIIRGKTLSLCLAADPERFTSTKYKVETLKNKNTATPLQYRIKNDRRLAYAMQLVDIVFGERGIEKAERKAENYAVPFTSTDTLIRRGLIRETAYTGARWRLKTETPTEQTIETEQSAEAAASADTQVGE